VWRCREGCTNKDDDDDDDDDDDSSSSSSLSIEDPLLDEPRWGTLKQDELEDEASGPSDIGWGKVQQSCVRCGNSDKNAKCLRREAVPMVVWCKMRGAPATASVRRHVPGLFLRLKLDDPMANYFENIPF